MSYETICPNHKNILSELRIEHNSTGDAKVRFVKLQDISIITLVILLLHILTVKNNLMYMSTIDDAC